MKNKFNEYYTNEKKIRELNQYIHENMKLIHSKMVSELSRKLDIEPDMTNKDGYVSLITNIQARMFNEMIYSLAGMCQSLKMSATDIIPISTIKVFINILEEE